MCFAFEEKEKVLGLSTKDFYLALYLTYDTMPTFETRRLSNVILLEFR